MSISLTRQAHEWLQSTLKPEQHAIDATAGNGHDTLFLANICHQGQIFSFDLQAEAIEQTRLLLSSENIGRVHLIHDSHERIKQHLPDQFHGQISALMMNLGYLPGGDHTQTTKPETTIAALNQALEVLVPGGKISVIAYTGHPGGYTEASAANQWFEQQLAAGQLEQFLSSGLNPPSPVWFRAEKMSNA